MNPNQTVRRVPSINVKGNSCRQIAQEIEEVRKQIQDQQDQLEVLERDQTTLLGRLKNANPSPLEQQAMEIAQRLNEKKKSCKSVMKDVVKLDESTQRRRKEMTVLWKKIQNQVHRGSEAQSTLRRRSINHNSESTKETKEKEAQVHLRWQRRLSL